MAWAQCFVLFLLAVHSGAEDKIVLGTVQQLSRSDATANTLDILAGYRFWVEYTNQQGGIRVGNETRTVELKVYNSEGDPAKQAEMYKRLVEEDGADFLLSGGAGSNRAMFEAGNSRQTIAISSMPDLEWDWVNGSLVHAIYSRTMEAPTRSFIDTMHRTWGLSRMALLWIDQDGQGGSGGIASQSQQVCQNLYEESTAGLTDAEVVFSGGVKNQGYAEAMAQIVSAGADFLVACVDTQEESLAIMDAAVASGTIFGWNADGWEQDSQSYVEPLVVESVSLKFFFFTTGADGEAWHQQLDGWVQRTVAPVLWHPDLTFQDAQFGDSAAVQALWADRVDYGDGGAMPLASAAAVAAGVVLRAAVESAGSVETGPVLGVLRGMEVETLFGRVRFGAGGANAGLGGAQVQWDCTLANLTRCGPRLLSGPPQPIHARCADNHVRMDVPAAARVRYEPATADGRPTLPAAYAASPLCMSCSDTAVEWLGKLLMDTDDWNTMVEACSVRLPRLSRGAARDVTSDLRASVRQSLAQPFVIGVALLAGPGDEDWRLGVSAALTTVLGFLQTLGVENLPYQLAVLDAAVVGAGDEVAMPAARAAVAEVEAQVEAQRPRSWMLWNAGMVEDLGVGGGGVFAGARCPGRGPQLSWGEHAVCVTPPPRKQGRALALVAEHFGWRRCHLVVSEGEGAAAAEFGAEAARLGVALERTVRVPAAGGDAEARRAAVEAAADLDDCEAAVVALLLTREDAEALFARVYGLGAWARERRFVVLGSEPVSRAWNAPRGLLALRSVASAVDVATRPVIGLAGGARSFGTGVEEPTPGGAGAAAEEAPWLDIGVEDRRLFVADMVQAMATVGITMSFLEQPLDDETLMRSQFEALDMWWGATGTLRFEAREDPVSGKLLLERVTGSFALVNKQGEQWSSLATLAIDGDDIGPFIHSESALDQVAWEETVADWGLAGREERGKPSDTCPCVLWDRMGPHSRITQCRWSADAIGVAVAAGVLLAMVAAYVWSCRRRPDDESDQVVRRRAEQLRSRLRLRKADGFVLASEGSWVRVNLRRDPPRVITRKQLDALARMTLLYDFEVRAVDALASMLLTGSGPRGSAFFSWLDDKRVEESRSRCTHDGDAAREHPKQYELLCELLLEVSERLLDPSVGADPAEKGSTSPLRMAMLRFRGAGEPASSPHPASPGVHFPDTAPLPLEAPSTVADAEQGERGAAGGEAPRSVEGRFRFFAAFVARSQPFQEDGGELFLRLKRGAVQRFMDSLHRACDDMLRGILKEPAAQQLVAYSFTLPAHLHPAAHADVIARSSSLLAAAPDLSRLHQASEGADSPASLPAVPSAGQNADDASDASVASDRGEDAAAMRQDHPLVRAIRLNEEDWREVDLEHTASARRFYAADAAVGLPKMFRPMQDEETFVSQLFRRATLLDDEFQLRVRAAVQRRFGARVDVHRAPIKTKARMREKLRSYASPWHGPGSAANALTKLPLAAHILDPVRATVVCDGPEAMLEVAEWLVTQGEEEHLTVVRVKNKFAIEDASQYDGYRDLMICVLFTGSYDLSIIGEIQVHDRRLHGLKLKMHKLYKVKRATKAKNILT